MSLVDTFRGWLGSAANAVRDARLTEEQRAGREHGKQLLEMVKIASIISVIVGLFLFSVFPSIFSFVSVGIFAFVASEVHKMADNLLEVLQQATVELAVSNSKEAFLAQMTKNTFLIGPILRVIDPDSHS